MSLFWQRQKPGIDRRQSLAGVPVLQKEVTVEPLTDETVTLKASMRRGGGWLDRFRPPVMERQYELDAFGSFVVRQIDSRRTVLDLIRAFEKRFGMSHREAELGVVAFIKMLMKRNLIAVVVGS